MTHLSKKSLLVATALVAGTSFAQATVITFDDGLDTSQALFAPLLTQESALYQGGFVIGPSSTSPDAADGDLVGALVDGFDLAATCVGVVCPTNNATTFYASLNDSVVYLAEASDSGVPFTLSSFKASFIGNGIDPLPTAGSSGVLQVLEVQTDGSYVTESFVLAPASATTGELSFSSYTSAYANVPLLAAIFTAFYCDADGNCTNSLTNKAQFALDDIDVSPVPEPASWGLTALGLAALAGRSLLRRRRRA